MVETIVVVGIVGIIMTVIGAIFSFGIKSFETTTEKGFTQQDQRLVVTKITRELRTAKEVKIGAIIEDEKYIWKELNREILKVDNVTFTGKGSLLTVMVGIKESSKKIDFTLMMENEKHMNFENEEKVIYSRSK